MKCEVCVCVWGGGGGGKFCVCARGLEKSVWYRVSKCDVIKMKFLKLWDLSGHSERTMSKRPTCQK